MTWASEDALPLPMNATAVCDRSIPHVINAARLGISRAKSETLLDETEAAMSFLGGPYWQAASDALKGIRTVLADVEAAAKGADLTGEYTRGQRTNQ